MSIDTEGLEKAKMLQSRSLGRAHWRRSSTGKPTGGRVGASLGSANARLLVGQKREGASWSAKDLDGVEMVEFSRRSLPVRLWKERRSGA